MNIPTRDDRDRVIRIASSRHDVSLLSAVGLKATIVVRHLYSPFVPFGATASQQSRLAVGREEEVSEDLLHCDLVRDVVHRVPHSLTNSITIGSV